MRKIMSWMLAAILCICGASVFTSCTSSDDNPAGPDADTPAVDPQVGAYVWGSTIYAMGADGAARLAEAYEKAGIQHAILLVKGENGTVGYLNNNLSKAPLSRTDRDILAETVSAMHERGIKVYAWITVGNGKPAVSVASDARIVYNAPIQ